jgi:hypothetical protein
MPPADRPDLTPATPSLPLGSGNPGHRWNSTTARAARLKRVSYPKYRRASASKPEADSALNAVAVMRGD